MRRFNIAGPCNSEQHYMVPTAQRLPQVDGLVEQGAYFVLHAPRQSGKTTAMQRLAQQLTAGDTYAALYFSCETARVFPEDIVAAERAIGESLSQAASDALPESLRPPPFVASTPGGWLKAQLTAWVRACPRPLVLIFDEIDAVEGEPLRSVLSQLRDGYNSRRTTPFPHAVILCGVRDVRDYKIASGGGALRLGTSSPFNIKTSSLRLANFSEAEVRSLYAQHTAETGQEFTEGALSRAFELTCGQPWLSNALAREVVEVSPVDLSTPIDEGHINDAKERLILARATHLDSLLARLHEERVRKVIEPILAGVMMQADVLDDDLTYVRDLGLVEVYPQVRIANAIYAEVIPRALTHVFQANIAQEITWYEREDGSLDMTALLEAFQEFFAEHSEAWQKRFAYQEAGPHLILMAFLQRLVNGDGGITREFAIGSGRVDLVLHWRQRRYVMELKIRRSPKTIDQGIKQLNAYLDRLGEDEGWLVVFDPRKTQTWEQKLYDKTLQSPDGRVIHLFGV